MTDYTKHKDADLNKTLGDKKRELQQMGFSLAAGADGSKRSLLKKEIARIATEISKRETA